MGFFNRSDRQTNIGTGKTIIATGSTICGTVEIECNLHIDGNLEGKINSKNVVIVGRNGSVKGDIIANSIIISGLVEGNVDAEKVEVLAGGKLVGSVTSKDLIIEKEGVFQGESKPLLLIGENKKDKIETQSKGTNVSVK
ncbi:MAG: polymer-forming cytoskeletal protein [Candidatus Delongbacteria bacterium]|nr:polymer-forming cytoskeletal protein [Candidatus Delongbacteria bacterium]MBN2835817.1 polymer-forming cytoskeletal protein [Candidatus Delongbacteria bacterium]